MVKYRLYGSMVLFNTSSCTIVAHFLQNIYGLFQATQAHFGLGSVLMLGPQKTFVLLLPCSEIITIVPFRRLQFSHTFCSI